MFLDDVWHIRARKEETEAIRSFLFKNDKYMSFSHFVRISVMKVIKEERAREGGINE